MIDSSTISLQTNNNTIAQPVGKVAHKMDTGVKTVYCSYMNKTTSNPYRQQMIDQGRDPIDRPILEIPAQYRDRFESYAEYQEAIHEMLNGM